MVVLTQLSKESNNHVLIEASKYFKNCMFFSKDTNVTLINANNGKEMLSSDKIIYDA